MMIQVVVSLLGLACVGLVVLGLLAYVLYSKFVSPFRILSKHNIPGPVPIPFLGNYLEIKRKGILPFLDMHHKQYGSMFGYYIGCQSRIVLTDLELLKQIMVKEFGTFQDRGFFGGPDIGSTLFGYPKGLAAGTGETWKVARRMLTPAFSSMKMKMMEPLIRRSVDILVVKVGDYAKSGDCVDLAKVYRLYTMECLMATLFGRYVSIQNGEGNELTDAASDVFLFLRESHEYSPDLLLLLLSNFPWLQPLLLWIISKEKFCQSFFLMYKIALTLVQERIKSQRSSNVKDLLHLLVEACVEEEGSTNGKKIMTEKQIASFSIDFLLAGHEATANSLSFTSYLLALNPEVQEKLQAEIDNYFEENPEVSLYEATQSIEYLDMVLQESMRLYPPGPSTHRYCKSTIQVGDVIIPEGAQVLVPIYLLHHMPEYWPDPKRFDPERFTAEEKAKRPQLAHMPFGWGPRNCIGMRFAQLDIKIALIEILKKYSFVRGPETEEDLQTSTGLILSPKNDVFLKVIARE